MKYMVISDIHGGIGELNRVLDIYKEEGCSKLLILGDLFTYGFGADFSRNDIINRLNLMKDNIIAVIGNCDNNLNGILFDMDYIKEIELNNKKIYLTHGDLFSDSKMLELNKDIIYTGHTHRKRLVREGDTLLVNPGSIAMPRDGEKSFAITDENEITLRNLNNEIIDIHYFNNKKKQL